MLFLHEVVWPGGHMTKEFINAFISDESGQGITEYGAILAFVALLVAVVFGFANGTLQSAISQSFSSVVSQLNQLNSISS
jgi:Flp pilus assembly pilin Flp